MPLENPTSAPRTATRVVAASDSPALIRLYADYIDSVADDVQLQAGIDALTASRTRIETVQLIGNFTMGKITLPSYTRLDLLQAILLLAADTDDDMIENSDQVAGNSYIEIIGGIINGNKANQAGGSHLLDFYGITDIKLIGVEIKNAYAAGCRINASVNEDLISVCRGVARDLYIHDSGTKGLGLRLLRDFDIIGGRFDSNGEQGVHGSNALEVRVTGARAYGNTEAGFMPSYSSGYWVFTGCVAVENQIGFAFAAEGIQLLGCFGLRNKGDGARIVNGAGELTPYRGACIVGGIYRLNYEDGIAINTSPVSGTDPDIQDVVIDGVECSDNGVSDATAGYKSHGIGDYATTGTARLKRISIANCHIFALKGTPTSLLTADAVSGQKDVVVTADDKFELGEAVTISDDTPDTESNIIASINTQTNTLTMVNNLTNTYTVAANALVTSRKTQDRGIYFQQNITDSLSLKNNHIHGNLTVPLHIRSGDVAALSGDQEPALIAPLDLSASAVDTIVFHADKPCALLGYTVLYTEASSGDAGVAIRIGRIQGDGTTDTSYFDSYTSEVSKSLGYVKKLRTADLSQQLIATGDRITIGTAGGKVGTGEVQVKLIIAEMAE